MASPTIDEVNDIDSLRTTLVAVALFLHVHHSIAILIFHVSLVASEAFPMPGAADKATADKANHWQTSLRAAVVEVVEVGEVAEVVPSWAAASAVAVAAFGCCRRSRRSRGRRRLPLPPSWAAASAAASAVAVAAFGCCRRSRRSRRSRGRVS